MAWFRSRLANVHIYGFSEAPWDPMSSESSIPIAAVSREGREVRFTWTTAPNQPIASVGLTVTDEYGSRGAAWAVGVRRKAVAIDG